MIRHTNSHTSIRVPSSRRAILARASAIALLIVWAAAPSKAARADSSPTPAPAAAAPVAKAAAAAPAPAPALPEAPSTVNATYVDPSATVALAPGQKLSHLYARNMSQPYILQRLTEHTYFFQRQFYGTTFYVGTKGVLLFDPLDDRAPQLLQAIAEVTKLPVTAIVYSHDHADHIGSAQAILDASKAAGVKKVRIIASRATADKMKVLKSHHPAPTEIVAWPAGSFKFEGLVVKLSGFERAAHADDHAAWLLVGEKVVHLPDHINPDQPPFWGFAADENFIYFESNLEQLAKLDWVYLNGGHGNVGSRADLDFYRTFIGDLKQAVGAALGQVPWGTGVDASRVNAHTYFLPAWLAGVAKKATDTLRPKYGRTYGFEAGTPRNAEMVALAMFSYR